MSDKRGEADCYETPDVVDASNSVVRDARQPDHPESSELDSTSFSSEELYKKFSTMKLDTSNQDYDRVAIGKPLRQFEYSVNPTGRNAESPLERYQRLRAEVESLASDLSSLGEASEQALEQGNTAAEISQQLGRLQGVLGECESRLRSNGSLRGAVGESAVATQLLKELQSMRSQDSGAEESQRMVYELYSTPSGAQQGGGVQLVDVERRIAALENAIGPAKAPLVATLAVVEQKVTALDDAKLKVLEGRIATLTKAAEGATQPDGKVDQLFELMGKWDGTVDQLPLVVERLVALREVHEQSVGAVETVRQLEADQTMVSGLLKSGLESLNQMEAAFEKNNATISGNVSALEQRMKALEAKLG